jgi:hypothetical protein
MRFNLSEENPADSGVTACVITGLLGLVCEKAENAMIAKNAMQIVRFMLWVEILGLGRYR